MEEGEEGEELDELDELEELEELGGLRGLGRAWRRGEGRCRSREDDQRPITASGETQIAQYEGTEMPSPP